MTATVAVDMAAWVDVIETTRPTNANRTYRPGAHHIRMEFVDGPTLEGHGLDGTGALGAWSALLGLLGLRGSSQLTTSPCDVCGHPRTVVSKHECDR